MAANFRIAFHRTFESLHVKLFGDFDGSSAHQLLNALKTHWAGASRVLIDTNCLRKIEPFGRDIFQNSPDLRKAKHLTLVFAGENAHQLAPEKAEVLSVYDNHLDNDPPRQG